ncbi:hypothetical protein J6G99_07360 [bacterium]|nr:hypothetical protein [bacterium]
MTIPSLLTTISDKVTKNKIAVFERKLSKGTDLLNIEYGIGPYYQSSTPSYEFAQALSKHLKIVTICDKNNLTNCFPYTYIQTEMGNKEVSDLKTGDSLQLDPANYVDTAGIVLGDGTPMIFSWNKNCPVSDPDSVEYNGIKENAKSKTTSCISGIYDINGSKSPNKFGKDVIAFGSANLGWINFAGLKLSLLKPSTPVKTGDYCSIVDGRWQVKSEYKTKYNIQNCCSHDRCVRTNGDSWAGAMIECIDAGGHLATLTDLAKIATYLYDEPSQIGDEQLSIHPLNLSKTGTVFSVLNTSDLTFVWSSLERDSEGAYSRRFTSINTSMEHGNRYYSNYMTLCVKGPMPSE